MKGVEEGLFQPREQLTQGLGLGIGLTPYRTPDVSFAGLSVRARVTGDEGDRKP